MMEAMISLGTHICVTIPKIGSRWTVVEFHKMKCLKLSCWLCFFKPCSLNAGCICFSDAFLAVLVLVNMDRQPSGIQDSHCCQFWKQLHCLPQCMPSSQKAAHRKNCLCLDDQELKAPQSEQQECYGTVFRLLWS